MKIVVTTPTGNIGSQVARGLVRAGERPLLLARNPAKIDSDLLPYVDVRQVDLQDSDAVVRETQGAEALFWLNPPNYGSADPIGNYVKSGESGARAVTENGIPRTVFVSSEGAQLGAKGGLIEGLSRTEQLFDTTGQSVVHLRAGFFFTNFLWSVESLRQGFLAAAAPANVSLSYVDPRDIADVAVGRLLSTGWSGRHVQPVHGPTNLTFAETAKILGEVLRKPVQYVEAKDEDVRAGLLAAGFMSPETIEAFLQMYRGLREDFVSEDPRTPLTTTPTTLAAWAQANLVPILG